MSDSTVVSRCRSPYQSTGRRTRLRVCQSLLLAFVICGLLAPPVLAEAGTEAGTRASKQKWLRLETDNFTIYSAAGEWQTRQAGRNLEALRGMLSFWAEGKEVYSPVPTFIYVFSGDRAFKPYKEGLRDDSSSIGGFFLASRTGNYAALDGSHPGNPTGILHHEYLHYFTFNNLPNAPLWFHEGLAEFYSTFEVDGDEVVLGRAVDHRLVSLRADAEIDLEMVFQTTRHSPEFDEKSRRTDFYAQSWGLVHYLMTGNETRSQQLMHFLRWMEEGADQQEAFARAFDIDLETLGREVEAHLAQQRLPGFRLSIQDLGESAKVKALERLPREEVLSELGWLSFYSAWKHPDKARAHFLEALEVNSQHAFASAGLGFLAARTEAYEEARRHYQRALESDSQDFRIHYLYGRSLLDPWTELELSAEDLAGKAGEELAAARSAFERSLSLNPDFAEGWARLGSAWSKELKPDLRGLEALQKARRLLPDRSDVLRDLAVTYARLGHREQARGVIQHDLVPLGDEEALEAARAAVLRADFAHADELMEAGQGEQAIALLEEILAQTTDAEERRELEDRLETLRAPSPEGR